MILLLICHVRLKGTVYPKIKKYIFPLKQMHASCTVIRLAGVAWLKEKSSSLKVVTTQNVWSNSVMISGKRHY